MTLDLDLEGKWEIVEICVEDTRQTQQLNRKLQYTRLPDKSKGGGVEKKRGKKQGNLYTLIRICASE